MALALRQELLDPCRAVAVEVLTRDVMRVIVRRDPVVRRDDHAALRVVEPGELVIGDVALPLVLPGPPGLRQVGTAAAPRGELPDELVADPSRRVPPHH